jgi:peptidoglycan/xylan/chitin deacetylase (PgdA/CDA1 family)
MDREQSIGRRAARRRVQRRRRLALLAVAGVLLAGLLIRIALGGSGSASHTAASVADTAVVSAPASPQFLPSPPVSPGTRRIPILMYHVIQAPSASAAFPGLWVAPSEFAGQMHALQRAGFRAISLDQAWAYWRYGAQLPAHPIIITFDNGYASQYSEALPILRAMGWIAVLNLQLSLHAPQGLSPKQVRGMVAAGWELDTQGFTHADLPTLGAARLTYEVAVSRQRIRRDYGVPVNWFCYPSGHYDSRVVAMVKAAGYLGSTTVIFGWGSPADTYRLARLRVLGGTSPQALLAQVLANGGDAPPPVAYPAGA